MSDWDDLSDDELGTRLTQRGIAPGLAIIMVEDRDCCDGCRRRITEALDG